jgi:hypothetical protein
MKSIRTSRAPSRSLSKRSFGNIAARGSLSGVDTTDLRGIPKSLWSRYDLELPATPEEIRAYFSNPSWQFFGQPDQTNRASSMVNTDVAPCDMLLHGWGIIMTVSTELSGITGIAFDKPAAEIATPSTDGTVPVTGVLSAFDNDGVATTDLANVNPACAEFGRAAQQAAVAFARSRRAEFVLGCEDFVPMSELVADIGLITDDPQYSGMGPFVGCVADEIRAMNDRYDVVNTAQAVTPRVFVPQTSFTVGGNVTALPPPTATKALVGQKLCGNFGGFFPLQNKFLLAQGMPVQWNFVQEEGTGYWQEKLIEAVSTLSAITYASTLGDNMYSAAATPVGKASAEMFKHAHLSITVIAKGERLTSLACAEAYESGSIMRGLSGLSREARDEVIGHYPIERWLKRAEQQARSADEKARLGRLGSVNDIRERANKTIDRSVEG